MVDPRVVNYEQAIQVFFTSHSSGADVFASSTSFSSYLDDGNANDGIGAVLSLIQMVDSFLSLVKDTNLGQAASVLSIANNLDKLKDQQDVDGVTPAIVADLISDISGFASLYSLALGPAGVPVFIVLSSISLVASVYSTIKGINISNENDALLLKSTQSLDLNATYNVATWGDYQRGIYLDYFKKNPITLPVLALMHEIDSNISPEEALGYIEGSDKTNLIDGRIPEASELIKSLVRIFLNADLSELTTKQEINNKVNELWSAFENNPLKNNVTFISPPTSGSQARNDLSGFLSLLYLTPFTLQVNDAGAMDFLYSIHEPTSSKWNSDRNLSAEQIANGEANFSDMWLSDRAAMLNAFNKANALDTNTFSGANRLESVDYVDMKSNTTVHVQSMVIGFGDHIPPRFIKFGDIGNNTLTGAEKSDRLYGMGGDDTLNGQAGDDYLEGNEGNDTLNGGDGEDNLLGGNGIDILDGGTGNDQLKGGAGHDIYNFIDQFGTDIITDTDGNGQIIIDGQTFSNANLKLDNIYKNDTTGYTFTRLNEGNTIVISKEGDANRIIINNWSETKSLGLGLTGSVPAAPAGNVMDGDFKKKIDDHGTTDTSDDTYILTNNNYTADETAPNGEADALDLINGTGGIDVIKGLGGSDYLNGKSGNDFIEGGGGGDYIQGGMGADTLKGGDGDDLIYGSSDMDISMPTEVDFTQPVNEWTNPQGTGFNWTSGYNDGNVYSNGTPISSTKPVPRNRLTGDQGNLIDGGAGNDLIAAGTGADYVHGGADKDLIYGMDKDDILFGDEGNDVIYGDGNQQSDTSIVWTLAEDHGDDIIDGGSGADILYGQGGNDIIFGGTGNDKIWGDDSDAYPGLVGDDFLYGGVGNDEISGDSGNDYIDGGADTDIIWGGAGNDYLDGGAGNDMIYGEAGNDVLIGSGNDYLDGGKDADTYYINGNDQVADIEGRSTIYIANTRAVATTNTQSSMQLMGVSDGVIASANEMAATSTLTVNTSDQSLNIALDNGTTVSLKAAFYGMDASLQFAGGEVIDVETLVSTELTDSVNLFLSSVILTSGATVDHAFGGMGNDQIVGDVANDTIKGYGGNDTLLGGDGNDVISGGDGNDILQGDAGDDVLDGGNGDDSLLGLDGNDSLQGGAGVDEIQGNAGNDILDGGADNDTLFGQAGNDTLDGGAGNDVLLGNAGDDVYLFNLGDGRDVVWEEGDTAGDVLRLGADIAVSDIVVYKSGVDLVLSHINGLDQVTIANWYVSPTYQLKQFEFSDGTIWNGVDTGNLGRLRGTAGNDVINGTAQNETLYGMDGNDTLYGGGGQDTFIGGNGSDRLYGSSGADMLLGEAGNDILDGGGGTDTFVGGEGNDDITGSYSYADTYVFALGDGADIINAYDSYARDTLRFETDILSTDISAERVGNNLVLRHQNGTDSVTLSNWYLLNNNSYQLSKVTFAADGVTWNTSALSTMGTNINHNYAMNLGDGAKTIEDWGGDDTLTIGNAIGDADIVISRVGQNLQLAHVNGVDMVTIKDWFSDLNKQIETITFVASGAVLTKDQIAQNFLNLTGTSGDDVIYGSDAYGETILGMAGNDTVYAGAGNDQVYGDAGNDILHGAAGKDKITGGTGNDTLYGGEDYDTYYFNQGDGQDTIIDTTYNELIFGNGLLSQFNPIWGGSSQDTVFQFGTDSVRIKLGSTVTPKFITNGTAQNDSLTGGTYGDYIYGMAGNDTIVGGSGADWLYGGDGDDILDGSFLTGTTDQQIYGSDSADFYVGGKGNDTLNGNSWEDTYYFNLGDGNDVIIEGSFFSNGQWFSSFQDTLVFGKDITLENIQASELNGDLVIKVSATDSVTIKNWFGDYKARVDYIKFDDGRILDTSAMGTLAYTKRGTAGDDVLTANSNGTWGGALYGEAGNDTLNGGSGSDQLHGGSGNDVLNGGSGNDMYYFERGGGQDQIIDSSGTDKVYFDASITAADISLSRNANDLVLTVNNAGGTLSIKDYFATANNIVESFIFTDGSSLPSTLAIQDSFLNIRGTSVDDDLTGTAYIDMMFGADGNDVLRGMAGNDTLYGNAGDDNLDGGLGNDTMVGAIGNDVYFVDSLSDVVTELINEGTDTVNSAINYTLGSNVENLTLTGSAVSGTGNELDNVFRGNSIANTFAGGIGNDSYYLGTGDSVTENTNAGTDTVYTDATYTLGTNIENGILTGTATVNITGNAADNVLTGNAAANTLSGGAGSDTLIGAQGNDTYILDVATDIVIENLNEGNDTVQIAYATAAATTLTAGTGQFSNIENITVTGTGSYNLTGDVGDNTLVGNASANVLIGNAGNDVLNGMGGADNMSGGLGNDTYTVDVLTDVITENLNEGIDLVNIAIATKSGTYTLGNNIENATVTSTVAYNVTGNALDNVLIGNSAANKLTGGAGNDTLDGGAGVDTMVGGAGDDIYIVDATRDVVTEAAGAGNDTVKSAVTYTLGATSNLENIILTGATAINATGNAYANLLMGNAANNVLTDTAGGNDVLQGMAGVDTFNDTAGNNLFDGGLGNDLFTAGAGRDIIIGGQGNDTITTGTGYDVIVFNKGDGQDIISASTGADNTISLGGNFAYSDLSLTKTGNDLILKMGSTDQITFKDWYVGTSNHSVVNLQVIAEAMAGFNLGGSDVLRDNNVENFNFANIVAAFDAAGSTANWQLTDSLLTTHLQAGGDSAAIGGDLAYQYGKNGNLSGMGLFNAQGVIGAASFGQAAQALNNPTAWQAEVVKLG